MNVTACLSHVRLAMSGFKTAVTVSVLTLAHARLTKDGVMRIANANVTSAKIAAQISTGTRTTANASAHQDQRPAEVPMTLFPNNGTARRANVSARRKNAPSKMITR